MRKWDQGIDRNGTRRKKEATHVSQSPGDHAQTLIAIPESCHPGIEFPHREDRALFPLMMGMAAGICTADEPRADYSSGDFQQEQAWLQGELNLPTGQ